jgi:hypothetical protein
VQRGTPETCSEIADRHFRWVLPAERAEHYAGLIDGMADCPGACHQYLEGTSSDVVIVTKGEYELVALRKMREAHP